MPILHTYIVVNVKSDFPLCSQIRVNEIGDLVKLRLLVDLSNTDSLSWVVDPEHDDDKPVQWMLNKARL